MKYPMPQMARTGKNGYGEPKPKKECKTCHELLSQNKFSYVVKNDISKGTRHNCKTCAANHAEKEKARRKSDWKYKPALHMLNNSKQRAKRNGIEHNLTISDIIIPDYCPVLGIKLETGDRREKENSPSIDRINNDKGYINDNIMIMSNRANMLKKDATIEELIMIGNFYREFKENQN